MWLQTAAKDKDFKVKAEKKEAAAPKKKIKKNATVKKGGQFSMMHPCRYETFPKGGMT
jgi:hypothetical protein